LLAAFSFNGLSLGQPVGNEVYFALFMIDCSMLPRLPAFFGHLIVYRPAAVGFTCNRWLLMLLMNDWLPLLK
jgi:hypothetical protein